MWIIAGAGFASCLFTFTVSLFPPGGIEIMPSEVYMVSMIAGTGILALPPLAFLKFRNASWMKKVPRGLADDLYRVKVPFCQRISPE